MSVLRGPTVVVAALFWVGMSACSAGPEWGVALHGNPLSRPQLEDAARATGMAPRLVLFFQQWPERPAAGGFPRETLAAIADFGAQPVLTWEPMYYARVDGTETTIPAARIVGGDYDVYLEEFAREAAAWGRPLIIRFAHEMNLSRYHWGGSKEEFGPASPDRYRAMWRRVVDVFRRARATNVRWAFSPNCESVPGGGNPAAAPWNTASAYYPGDDYVDLVGMDGYNWGETQTPERHGWRSTWRGFAETFGGLHTQLRALAPDKPVYVFETASAATGGNKAAWLAELARVARSWNLRAVVWFQVSKEVDWRIQTGVAPTALDPLRQAFSASR